MKRAARLMLVAALALLAPGTARAQEAPADSVQAAPTGGADPGTRAARIGVAATLVPLVAGGVILAATDADALGFYAMYGGVVLGPAIGNWSGGLAGRGFGGLAIRSALAVGTLIGPFVICPGLDECSDAAGIGALAAFIGGNVLLLAHAAYDLGGIPKAVRRDRGGVVVSPVWHPSTGAAGLAVHVTF